MLTKKFFWKAVNRIDGDAYVIFNYGWLDTIKYSLPNGVVEAGTSLPPASSYSAAAGNAEQSLFFGGVGTDIWTSKYFFADDTVASGPAAGMRGNNSGAAAGNAELILYARATYTTIPSQPTVPGQQLPTATILRYTYAGDALTSANSLSSAVSATASTGNAQFALFRLSTLGSATERIAYATDTHTAGPALTSYEGAFCGGSGTGNGVFGILKGGRVNLGDPITANKIHFASNTCVNGGSLLYLANGIGGGMAGTVNVSIFSQGSTESGGVLYYYATDTSIYAVASFRDVNGPGVCANPQGVNV